jgi:hypothetical protein
LQAKIEQNLKQICKVENGKKIAINSFSQLVLNCSVNSKNPERLYQQIDKEGEKYVEEK